MRSSLVIGDLTVALPKRPHRRRTEHVLHDMGDFPVGLQMVREQARG